MAQNRILNLAAGAATLLSLSLGFFLFFPHAKADSQPQFWLTWHASGSNIPPSYIGKALPSYGAQVTAEIALISNGKVDNLSRQTVYWYLDGTLIGGGVGAQKVTFVPFGTPPNTLTLKAELPSYNGMDLVHTIQLPFVDPVAVIEAPYPNGGFSSNPVTLTALPYFFSSSASNLSYAWAVNGKTGASAENPETAQVTLPQGTPSGTGITISLTVQNPSVAETADAQSTLTYNSQL